MSAYRTIYEVRAENLSRLGGPMGTEYTTTMWRKYTHTVKLAKELCEKHYSKNSLGKIKWEKLGKGTFHSGDLSWVMYKIKPIKVED